MDTTAAAMPLEIDDETMNEIEALRSALTHSLTVTGILGRVKAQLRYAAVAALRGADADAIRTIGSGANGKITGDLHDTAGGGGPPPPLRDDQAIPALYRDPVTKLAIAVVYDFLRCLGASVSLGMF